MSSMRLMKHLRLWQRMKTATITKSTVVITWWGNFILDMVVNLVVDLMLNMILKTFKCSEMVLLIWVFCHVGEGRYPLPTFVNLCKLALVLGQAPVLRESTGFDNKKFVKYEIRTSNCRHVASRIKAHFLQNWENCHRNLIWGQTNLLWDKVIW